MHHGGVGHHRRTGGGADGRLFIDATNALRWGPHIRTGIARVEASLIAEALAAFDHRFQLFGYDPTLMRCRLLTDGERRFLEASVSGDSLLSDIHASRLSVWERVRETARVYRLNPFYISQESHRAISQFITGSKARHGPAYSATKLLVRVLTFCFRVVRSFVDTYRFALEDPLARPGNRCLLSINTCHAMYRAYGQKAIAARISLFVYDTIPLDFPRFVTKNHAGRFLKGFEFGVAVASDILAISKATKDTCVAWLSKSRIGIDDKRFYSIAIASPLQAMATEPVPVAELAESRFVVYCSTIEPRKNHLLLLRLWSNLARVHGTDRIPTLVFVGKWAWHGNPIAPMLARDRQLRSVVRIFSSLPDEQLIWLYAHAEFTVFPSTSEGWGLGASESLDLGTPVVISDIPPLREATQNLMPALPPDDIRKWEQAISQLISDPDALARLRCEIQAHYRRRSPADMFREIVMIMSTERAAAPSPE